MYRSVKNVPPDIILPSIIPFGKKEPPVLMFVRVVEVTMYNTPGGSDKKIPPRPSSMSLIFNKLRLSH